MTYMDDALLGSILDRLQRTYVELQVAISAGGLPKEAVEARRHAAAPEGDEPPGDRLPAARLRRHDRV